MNHHPLHINDVYASGVAAGPQRGGGAVRLLARARHERVRHLREGDREPRDRGAQPSRAGAPRRHAVRRDRGARGAQSRPKPRPRTREGPHARAQSGRRAGGRVQRLVLVPKRPGCGRGLPLRWVRVGGAADGEAAADRRRWSFPIGRCLAWSYNDHRQNSIRTALGQRSEWAWGGGPMAIRRDRWPDPAAPVVEIHNGTGAAARGPADARGVAAPYPAGVRRTRRALVSAAPPRRGSRRDAPARGPRRGDPAADRAERAGDRTARRRCR